MKVRRWAFIAILTVLVVASGLVWLPPDREKLVYAYSDQCGHCSAFAPVLARVIASYPDVEVKRLQIERTDDYAEAKKLGVTGTPEVLVLRTGTVTARLEGNVPEQVLRRFLEKHLAETTH